MGFFIFLVICRIFCCGMLTLSCGKWDLVPWQGIKPGPLHSECRVLITGPLGKSQRVRIPKSKQSSNPCFGLLRLGSPPSGWATCYSTMPFPCLQSGLLCIVSTDFYNKSEKKKQSKMTPRSLFNLYQTSLSPSSMSKDYLSILRRITL